MTPNTQTHFRSLESIGGKVIPNEIFQKCRGERDAMEDAFYGRIPRPICKYFPSEEEYKKRREQLTAHYTRPGETPEERSAMLLRHYTHPGEEI